MNHDHPFPDPLQEGELKALLTMAAQDPPAGIDLLGKVRRADRRSRRRVLVPALSALGTASLAGAAVLAVTSLTGTPSARAQVAAAAEHTSGQGFRVHIDTGGDTGSPGALDGVFDPVRRTGRMTTSSGGESRYLGDLVYTYVPERDDVAPPPGKARPLPGGRRWIVYERQATLLAELPPVIGLVKLAPQDPQLALRQLRSATDVRERGAASGAGWTGHRYTFTVSGAGQKGRPGQRAGGSVDVDDQGRVRRLDLTLAAVGAEPARADKQDKPEKTAKPDKTGKPGGPVRTNVPLHLVMVFSGYGARVDVTPPPAREVVPLDRVSVRGGATGGKLVVVSPQAKGH